MKHLPIGPAPLSLALLTIGAGLACHGQPANAPRDTGPMGQLEQLAGKPLTDLQKQQVRQALQERNAAVQAAQEKFAASVAAITGIPLEQLRTQMRQQFGAPGGGAPGGGAAPAAAGAAGVLGAAPAAISLKPLTDLGTGTYQGFPGGLYPGGSNQPPADYLKLGLAQAKLIQPLDGAGQPSPNGQIVLLSVGMSNTTQEFSVFKPLADADPRKNPDVVIVDGAQGSQDAERVKDPQALYWSIADQRLQAAGATARQVQAVWLKEAIAGENEAFPADVRHLQQDLQTIVDILRRHYPNLRIVYLSSRIYAGYARSQLNPEPYAYQSGFAVKWLIEDHIKQGAAGPWLAWGPYLWTNGTKGRADGLVWEPGDVREDGTHPSPSGARKVADLLLKFFTSDETAKVWFVKG